MAAGALFSRFKMVALLLAVLTADFAAFWLAACWNCCAEFMRLVTSALMAGFVVLVFGMLAFC